MSFYNRLHKKNIVAKPGFNRWLVPPASIAIHLCIGSVYAWSMFNPALVKVLGVVTSSGDDWNLSQVVWIFSVAIVSLGCRQHMLENGLRRLDQEWSGLYLHVVGVVVFLLVLGIYFQELGVEISMSIPVISTEPINLQLGLYLLYFGYGVIGGVGLRSWLRITSINFNKMVSR